MVTQDEQALLNACNENWWDEAPWSVYLDYLLEQGRELDAMDVQRRIKEIQLENHWKAVFEKKRREMKETGGGYEHPELQAFIREARKQQRVTELNSPHDETG